MKLSKAQTDAMVADWEDDDEDDFDDDEYLDCQLGPDGQCAAAGTEECDWECPYSHGEFYAGSNAWHKKHNAGVPVEGCMCDECRNALKGGDA